MLSKIRKFIAPEVLFGEGSASLAGRFASNYGARKVLVVSDPGVEAAGHLESVLNPLRSMNIPYAVFTHVSPNPKDTEVMEGCGVFLKEGCNLILAVGGGSPMDCAKGIGICSVSRRDILEFEGADKIEIPCPPLICVPTTAGSSADVSQFAVINDTRRKLKIAIVSKAIVPDTTLIDPLLTHTMSPYLTACTGLDALTHAIEAYVSNANFHIANLQALEAVKLIGKNLIRAVRQPHDTPAREAMMLASFYAGLAFSNASLGIVHAMAHSLGGFLDLAHGESNAILLPFCVDFNFDAAADRYADILDALGGGRPANTRQELIKRLHQLNTDCGITRSLSAAGLRMEDIPLLSEKAANDVCLLTNPKPASVLDIEEVFRHAF